ncbi:hypothetical protein E3N88_44649 [Mikania micrantha]|uniref:Uncharacterized protein n=1 Tax=Mikania micrantha TaxID=192012 RepID=A0A5N6LBD9_9ASTR|nr:hypothetical protein E3N88_44649 [Mikania micrantha]
MKLGLLGSTETHRGTRWAPKWAFAAREAQVGEFEFSEIHRGELEIEETIHDVEVEERMTFRLSDEEQAMDEWMRTNSPELQSKAQSED